jgi:hypothetical protein
MINTILNIAIILSVFYFLSIFISKVFNSEKDENIIVRDNVLLVIAHPDDECMYVYISFILNLFNQGFLPPP